MVAATKEPGDEPGFSAVRRPAISPTLRQSKPAALSGSERFEKGDTVSPFL
jgi:hypothetical protein